MSKIIKVIVGCESEKGKDLFFVKVEATQEQIDAGLHYDAAEGIIQENYEVEGPFWSADETDPCAAVFCHFEWETADITYVDPTDCFNRL